MTVAKPQSLGLIDTIGAGYQAIHRRPWVLGIPVALNAYLWLGAPVSLRPLAERSRDTLMQGAGIISGDARIQEALTQQLFNGDGRLLLAWLNLAPILAPQGVSRVEPIPVSSAPQLLLAIIIINLVALLLSSMFLTILSGAVQSVPFRPLDDLRRSTHVAGQLLLALLIMIGVGLVLGLPFLAISAIVIVALPAMAPFLFLGWYIALFWAYIYTGFAPEAIVISRISPLRAIYHSVNIVRRNLTATLGLLLISFVIMSGLGVVWQQISAGPAGLTIAILGSAYIGSGLSAARMEFYRQRRPPL